MPNEFKCKVCGKEVANGGIMLCTKCEEVISYCKKYGLLNERAYRDMCVKHDFAFHKNFGLKPKVAIEQITLKHNISYDTALKILYTKKAAK